MTYIIAKEGGITNIIAMAKLMTKLSAMQIHNWWPSSWYIRGIASAITNGIAYWNVSDVVANGIAHVITNTIANYMAKGIDNGKAKDIDNDMTNDTANGLVKVKVTSKTIPFIIAVT